MKIYIHNQGTQNLEIEKWRQILKEKQNTERQKEKKENDRKRARDRE